MCAGPQLPAAFPDPPGPARTRPSPPGPARAAKASLGKSGPALGPLEPGPPRPAMALTGTPGRGRACPGAPGRARPREPDPPGRARASADMYLRACLKHALLDISVMTPDFTSMLGERKSMEQSTGRQFPSTRPGPPGPRRVRARLGERARLSLASLDLPRTARARPGEPKRVLARPGERGHVLARVL